MGAIQLYHSIVGYEVTALYCSRKREADNQLCENMGEYMKMENQQEDRRIAERRETRSSTS